MHVYHSSIVLGVSEGLGAHSRHSFDERVKSNQGINTLDGHRIEIVGAKAFRGAALQSRQTESHNCIMLNWEG